MPDMIPAMLWQRRDGYTRARGVIAGCAAARAWTAALIFGLVIDLYGEHALKGGVSAPGTGA